MLVKLGVPYAEAWAMPVPMALDMLGFSHQLAKSKQKAAVAPATQSKPSTNNPTSSNAPRKLVAARRKSKTKA